jgi:hypothetical protein
MMRMMMKKKKDEKSGKVDSFVHNSSNDIFKKPRKK